MTDSSLTELELDVRGLPCANRRAIIFGNFDNLAVGESLIVINDHEPVGLRGHFEDVASGCYEWEPLQRAPDAFRIRITRAAYSEERARAGAVAMAALTHQGCDHDHHH